MRFKARCYGCWFSKKSKRVTNLLTADLELYLEVSERFNNAINSNHIRTGAWRFNGATAEQSQSRVLLALNNLSQAQCSGIVNLAT